MSYRSMEDQQRAVEAAKLENSKKETRLYVYRKWERVLPCEANDRRITDIVDRWLDHNQDILHTPALFEAAIAQNPTDFNSLAKDSAKNISEQLIDQIVGMLAAHGKAHDDFTLKSERTRLSTFTIMALRQRLEDLQRSALMASKSITELRQIVASGRPAQQVKVLPAEYTRERIHAMPPYQIRKLIRDFTA